MFMLPKQHMRISSRFVKYCGKIQTHNILTPRVNKSVMTTTSPEKNNDVFVEDTLRPGQQEPILTPATAKSIAADLYGFNVTRVQQLESYCDKNFKLSVDRIENNDHIAKVYAHGYLLKVINSLDSKTPILIDGQFAMMQHLNNRGIRTNSVIPQKTGRFRCSTSLSENGNYDIGKNKEFLVYALSFVPGVVMKGLPYTPHLASGVGDFLGRVQKALRTFDHPGKGQQSRTSWNMTDFPDCRNYVHAIEDEQNRQLILEVISEFEDQVLKVSSSFQKGYIHNDFNEGNLLVQPSTTISNDYDVCGVIDFGDSHHGCIVYDLSICLTYVLLNSDLLHPIECAGHALAGFLQHVHLMQEERTALRICILARLAQSMSMGMYYYANQREDNEYLLLTSDKWHVLRRLKDTTSEEFDSVLRSVLHLYGMEWTTAPR